MSLFAIVKTEDDRYAVVNTETDETLHTADTYRAALAILDDLETSRKDEPR